ncbi:transcription initiation factor TFIID subunit 12 [Melia azedarach]|uniref:Transcription initiation factor TFIID subunit 12 n=1 Tax=Melia azedarach TaxID=155640 RepID=A0ACC1X1M0_MELAZ|nr:transcription initiation factor TFIID subunit 12 [Melia azedarach]
MDQQQQQQTQTPAPPTTTNATSQPTETASQPPSQPQSQPPPQRQQQQQQQPQPQQTPPAPPPSTPTTTPATNAPNPSPTPTPNPNPTSKPSSLTPTQPRPAAFSRPWQQPQQQQHTHFSHFSSIPSSSSSASPSSSISPSISAPPRGGIAIGVPAPRPSAASPQPAPPFSSSFGQQFGGLGRAGVNVPDSVSTSSPLQVRPPGMQGVGVMGSLGSSSQMRPGGISAQHHQQRPVQQSSLRPPPSSPNSPSPAMPNFQGQGLMRVSSVGSPGSPSPNTSQSVQSFNQPWLSSGSQGKPPLPPPSTYRPQMSTPTMQQRSHIPQQHSPLSTTSQQHGSSVQPQQLKPSHQLQEHYGQHFSSPRGPQSLPHQQQITRPQGSAVQKPSSLASAQPNTVQPANQSKVASAESDEFGNRILSKRSIHELVNQIDPSERLDSEVEDILVDIAEDFVESITTFGCSLAKHRKSDTLEAKDILLHLERNWNMMLPGFSGDEIKTYRKPLTNDIHKERLAVIKKSAMATEVASTRTSAGQAAVNAKGNMGKVPASVIGST